MKTIINPTDKQVYIVIKGDVYEVEANSTLEDVPEDVVAEWIAVHQFLGVSNGEEVKPKSAKEPKTDVKTQEEEIEVETNVKKKITKKSK